MKSVNSGKRNPKTLLIKLHLYCGLFTAIYLVAFGISAFILNHNLSVENTAKTKETTAVVTLDPLLKDQPLAESIRDQLGLMGWVPPWEYKRSDSTFSFLITHPGRDYWIRTDLKSNRAVIGHHPKGLIAVFHGLHFFKW